MAPRRALSARRTMAKLTSSPRSYFSWCVPIHCSAIPSSYGCGTLSVVEAISRSPARRWTSRASPKVNGLRIRRVVSSVGRSFMALYFQEHLTPGFSRCRKPQRGTSGGWRQSAANPCSARALVGTPHRGFALSFSPERTASASSFCSSIELSRECPIRVMRKEPFDLMQSDSRSGEPWECLLTEEPHLAGFQAWGGTSSYDVTQEESLVDMEQHGGMRMFVSIIQGDQFGDLRRKARLLLYFTHHRLRRRLPHIGPPAWERPQAIRFFPNEQQTVLVEDSTADVHFGRSVSLF